MASGKIIKRRKEKVRKVKKGDVTGLENAPSTSPFIKKLASNGKFFIFIITLRSEKFNESINVLRSCYKRVCY